MTRRFLTMMLALTAAWAATAMVSGAQSAHDAARALRAAIETETINGDVAGAIAQYRILAVGEDRRVAAHALLRLGRRQAISGNDAREIYEQIVRDFADQPGAAAEAATRLAELEAGQSGAQHRLVWDNAIDLWGGVSSDGRWLSFVDWETGDLGLRDLSSGQNRRLTDYGGFDVAQGEVEANIISPDGQRIAFTWDRFDESARREGQFELRVIDIDGSNPQTLLRGGEYAYLEPQAWSPDGESIAVQVSRPAETPTGRGARPGGEVLVVDASNAESRVVAVHGDARPNRLRYSPDGRWIAYDLRTGPTQRPDGGVIRGITIVRADGSQEPSMLVDGASIMGWTPDGRQLLFARERFGERELQAQTFADGRVTGRPERINAGGNLGDPMGVTSDGRLFYGRTRQLEDAVLAQLDATGSVGAIELIRPVRGVRGVRGSAAPQFSPDGRRLAMVTGPASVVVRDMESGDERVLLPGLSDIRALRWASDARSLFLAGDDDEPGVFQLDLTTSATTRLLSTGTPVFGVSPDNSTLYFRQPPGIFAHDLRSGTSRQVAEWTGVVFDIVPSPDGRRLAITGANQLVFVDLRSGESTVRWRDPGTGVFQRVREGAWTADSLTFVTHFWEGSIARELWRVSVTDGEPTRLPLDGRYMGVSLSPDGRRVAMMRVETVPQLWVLENFLPTGAR